MGNVRTLSLISLVVIAVLVLFTVYTVKETERGLLLRLGEIVDEDLSPGLHFKIPGYHTVKKFDGRILALDTKPSRFFTLEKKEVNVDFYVKWRIKDQGVKEYYINTGGDENRTALLLTGIIEKKLRDEFAQRSIREVVSGEREEIMELLVNTANQQANELGVDVVDIRVKAIDFPAEVSESIYARMKAAREKIARDFRSRGAEEAEKVRADADRQRTIIMANAYRESEELRGEGDAKAAEIYASAYNRDPEFYAFTRRLNAYKNTLNSKNDVLVVKPDTEFFKYFNSVDGE